MQILVYVYIYAHFPGKKLPSDFLKNPGPKISFKKTKHCFGGITKHF